MADAKITSLAALAADPANNDMFVIVDVSDTSMASTGTDKKLAASYLMKASQGLLASGASAGATAGRQSFALGASVGSSGFSGSVLNGIDSAGATFLEISGNAALFNSFIGLWSGRNNSTGYYNSFIGVLAGEANTTGYYNSFIGAQAGYANSTGFLNSFIGVLSGRTNSTGYYNSFIGSEAGYINSTGYYNTSIGVRAGFNNNGNSNTFIGVLSGFNNNGNSNNFIGVQAGYNNTGNSNNFIWAQAGYNETGSNKLYIANSNTATPLIYGDFATGLLTLHTVDTGTNAVTNTLTINHLTSGTPAAGYGTAVRALLESSTTESQDAGRLSWAWSTATHASRAAVGKLTAYYTSTEREAITWTADSTSVTVAIPNGPLTTGEIRATGAAGVKLTDSSGVLGVYVAPSGAVSVGNTTGITVFNVLDGTTSKGLLLTPLFGGSAYLFAYDIPGTTHIPFVLRANTFDLQTGTSSTTSRLTISASGEIRGNYDTNSTAYFGRCAIGYNGSTSDVASFGHVDMNTSANIALFQTAAGESWFNCASGQNLIFARGGFSLGQWDTSGNLHPAVDNTVDCGKSGARWNDIWASNATIQTSDQRDKRALQPSALGLDFVKALQPVSWVWADKGKRPHFGFIAQQVKQAMDAVGVDDFAGYIYDEETDSYSLRYSEFLSPIVKALQELLQRVERLEKAN